ncbi:MAG: YceI family protein [Spartobacteria bacterium]|nr:YceI family protein [Spartobacteria bacterium]
MHVNHLFRIGLFGWILPGVLLASRAQPARTEVWQGKADIEFQGTSTLHDFSGTVRTRPFTLVGTLDESAATLGGTATVAVAEMDTRHAKRDENMRKMFAADRFPLLAGVLNPIRFEPAARPELPLHLTIRDQTQTVPATLTRWQRESETLQFDLNMVLSPRALGLSPPVLMGFIRVGDAVSVRIRAELALAELLSEDEN